jgi:hypothetical protein
VNREPGTAIPAPRTAGITPADVARIAAIADPVIRNLEITACYARLSAALAQRTGTYSNWCTFATWASRQAGATIRGEDLGDRLQRRLHRGAELLHPVRSLWRALLQRGVFRPETRLGRIVRAVHTPFDAFERTSAAVARGNLKVFEEIGREFARYLQACSGPAPDPAAFAAFLDGLRPGDPPDGQQYLRQAFTRYHQQISEPDAARRAELIALANLEIGLHEQTRLQPEIRESLDAPIATKRDLRARVLDAVLPARGAWRALAGRGPLASLIVALVRPVSRFSERLAREVITESLMVLTLPGGTLALGHALDRPIPARFLSPVDADFRAFFSRYETCEPGGPMRAVQDWSELPQRMHFILHLFCAFHDAPDLFGAPFTDEQLRQVAAGRIPAGVL